LPAGDVDAAFGATWRRDRINDTPGAITLANNAWGASGAGITKGKSETLEYFGEADIPILADEPFVKYFNLRLSGRWTEVSTVDDSGTETYKVGANWQVNDWLRFRGTYGTSFRAPALFELFLADQTSFLAQRNIDPCINWQANLDNDVISQQLADNCAADGIPGNYGGGTITATVITGGGLGLLKPETSVAKSIGTILTLDKILKPDTTKISIALDYFEIEVVGEVAQLGAGNIVSGCYNSDSFPTDPLCSLFTRNPPPPTVDALSIAEVRDSFININSQKNRGIDLTTLVRQELPNEWGDLSILAQMSWQFQDTFALFAGTEQDSNGEDGEPTWVGNFNIEWQKGEWSVFWGIDAVQHTSDIGDFIAANDTTCAPAPTPTNPNPTSPIFGTRVCRDLIAESKVYHSLSITREIEDWKITVGIANLFDEEPPRVSTNNLGEISTVGQAPFTSNYDFVGRRGFLSVTKKF
jgi:iron complex outermembrane receptor protein